MSGGALGLGGYGGGMRPPLPGQSFATSSQLSPAQIQGVNSAAQLGSGYGPQTGHENVVGFDAQPFGPTAQQRGLLGPAPAGMGAGEQAKGRPGYGGAARALFAPSPIRR